MQDRHHANFIYVQFVLKNNVSCVTTVRQELLPSYIILERVNHFLPHI